MSKAVANMLRDLLSHAVCVAAVVYCWAVGMDDLDDDGGRG